MVEEVATCNCERWQTLEWSMNTLTLMSPIPTIAQSRNKCLRVIFSLENDMRSFVSCCVSIFNYNICSVCDESMKKKPRMRDEAGEKKALNQKSASLRKKNPNAFLVFNINADNWHEVRAREFPTFLRILCCWHALSLALWQKHTQLNTKPFCRDVSCSNFIVSCLSSINHPRLLVTNYEHAYYVKQQLLFAIIIQRIIAYASYIKWNHTNMRRTKHRSIGTSRNWSP